MKRIALLVFGLALAAGSTAVAAPITFEGADELYRQPITRSGFDIGNPDGQLQHFHETSSRLFDLPDNGTGVLLNDRDTEIFVQATGGRAFFSLVSVDVAAALNNFPAVGLEIRGFVDDTQVGSIEVADLGLGYTTISGRSLGLVNRLVFDGIGGEGGFVLDNLDLAPAAQVPEPASATLMCIGVGLALRRWRRRR